LTLCVKMRLQARPGAEFAGMAGKKEERQE
jgi:hypothetical protein